MVGCTVSVIISVVSGTAVELRAKDKKFLKVTNVSRTATHMYTAKAQGQSYDVKRPFVTR